MNLWNDFISWTSPVLGFLPTLLGVVLYWKEPKLLIFIDLFCALFLIFNRKYSRILLALDSGIWIFFEINLAIFFLVMLIYLLMPGISIESICKDFLITSLRTFSICCKVNVDSFDWKISLKPILISCFFSFLK